MPRRSRVPCGKPGCPTLIPPGTGRCDAHQTEAYRADRDARGSAADRGYDARWKKRRDSFLRKHPLCAMCERSGKTEAANTVDHIIPVSGPGDPLFWDERNWQSLSTDCHNRKTAEDKRKGLTRG